MGDSGGCTSVWGGDIQVIFGCYFLSLENSKLLQNNKTLKKNPTPKRNEVWQVKVKLHDCVPGNGSVRVHGQPFTR